VAFAFLATSAVIPSLLLIWYFHARDVHREPARVLWATFFLGVLTIPGVLAVVLPVMKATGIEHAADPYARAAGSAFIGAAIPEEAFKYLVVAAYAARHREFDEPMDGIVYGVAASLGFATLENVLYVAKGGLGVALLRAFTAVPGHAFAGAIMGYYIGQAKFRPEARARFAFAAFFFPMLLHGIYDFAPMALEAARAGGRQPTALDKTLTVPLVLTFFVVLIVEAVWAFRASARLRREQLAAQQAAGPALGMQPAWAGAPGFAPPVQAAFVATPGFAPAPQGSPPIQPLPGYPAQGVAGVPNVYHAPGAALAPVAATGSRVKGWLLVVPGIVLAGGGGLLTLGIALAFLTGGVAPGERVAVLLGTAFIGLLPLALGMVAFALGLRELNRTVPQSQSFRSG
jgi:protease PrsW